MAAMGSACSQTSDQQELTEGLLSALPEHLFTILFKQATPVRLRADQTLFRAGDVGDGCYRVVDGLLKVTIDSSSGSERILAFVGPGAIVGEIAVIDRLPRSASVIAVRNSVLSFLSLPKFEDFARKRPEIYETLPRSGIFLFMDPPILAIQLAILSMECVVQPVSFVRIALRVACA